MEEGIDVISEKKISTLPEEETQLTALDLSIQLVAQWITKSERVVVFSGAGISVESGIPDFRSTGGLWEKFDPSTYAHYETFLLQPSMFWEMSKEMAKLFVAVKPNPAHLALAELERLGKVCAIITQNIDNLHQDAGSKVVYELHGNAKSASCIECKKKYTSFQISGMLNKSEIPTCVECGELIKTDVILFGEKLPTKILEDAMGEAQDCNLIIMIGSSLSVAPANLIPAMAKMSGAKVVFINKDPTSMDTIADLVLCGNAGEILPRIVEAYKKLQIIPETISE